MDDAREVGRTMRAAERVRGWVAEAREDVAAALAMGAAPSDLASAARALNRAAARLVQVDRERAIEEADIALLDQARRRGDAALVAELVCRALTRALAGDDGLCAAARADAARPGLRAISA